MNWKQRLGANIEKARLDFPGEMSQEKLADAAGLTRNSIGHYERGKRAPNFDVLRRIAAALKKDHFDIDENMRVEFSANGSRPEPLPQQLDLRFDENNGVNVRIESAREGVIIKKISA